MKALQVAYDSNKGIICVLLEQHKEQINAVHRRCQEGGGR